MQEGLRIVAGDREAGFLRRLARVAVIDQHGSQHHRQLFDRLGEDGIVVDRAADQQRDLLGLIGPKIFHIAAKRSPVRLGIHNVGRYRGGAEAPIHCDYQQIFDIRHRNHAAPSSN